jgi:4-hydroxy-tetrahydrodipicolinate reductase
MRIALIGYGKLGQAIEQVALRSAHQLSFCIASENAEDIHRIDLDNTDVVIEATRPELAEEHIRLITGKRLPIVVATTGWYESLGELQAHVEEHHTALIYGSNFSIGVNILFKINRMLATLMNRYPHYDVFIDDRHHRHKADAPSGTAMRLVYDTLQHLDRKDEYVLTDQLQHRPPEPNELCVSSIRAGEIIGEHRVVYTSAVDQIEIYHRAFSREGFALGAVIAAEWIVGKVGVFEFSEVLG